MTGSLLRYTLVLAVLAVLAAATAPAGAAVDVVTSIPELAAIAREVGGDHVAVVSIAKPDQDYHRVEARPSDVARIGRADLFVRVGMDFDLWADALLASARNPRVAPGGPGYVDASQRIRKIEVPLEKVTGASGDIHVWGNPHYYYDPGNAKVVAYNILLGLRRVAPGDRAAFDAGYRRFTDALDVAIARWRHELAGCKGKAVVIYHKNLSYFMERFGIDEFGSLEPRPGIPPSPAHIRRLVEAMKREGVKALVIESIYGRRYPEFVARETGARLVWVPYSVGSMGTRTYFELIGKIVDGFRAACQ